MNSTNVVAIIPAYNEERHIISEISLLKKAGISKVIVSIDANSTDLTNQVLDEHNINYVTADRTGYDYAMQAGVLAISNYYPTATHVLFTSTGNKYDYKILSSYYKELSEGAYMVMSNRNHEDNFLLWHQKIGTLLVLSIVNIYFQQSLKDIGPLRIIEYKLLKNLDMQPTRFRWTTEMLVKCLALGFSVGEVDITSKKRIGKSKITGQLGNSLKAGIDMFSALKFLKYKIKN